MMSEELQHLRFSMTYRKSDAYRAVGYVISHSLRFYLAGFVICNFVFLLAQAYELSWFWVLATLIVYSSLAPILLALTSMGTPGGLGPVTFTFTETAMTAETPQAKSSLDWVLIKGATETKSNVFVKFGRDCCFVIPKAQITKEQLSPLRSLLRAHIAKKVSLFAD